MNVTLHIDWWMVFPAAQTIASFMWFYLQGEDMKTSIGAWLLWTAPTVLTGLIASK